MIVGLCGAAGAGKDTVAEILAARYGAVTLAFAEPLYAAVAIFTGMTVEELHDRDTKEMPIDWLGKSPRQLLQTLGTEWGRQIVRDDIWISIAMRKAGEYDLAVITDCRFENEAAAIKDAGGTVWRVDRRQQCLDDEARRHSSEAGIPEYLVDAVIDNNGTLDALVSGLDAAMQRLPQNIM